jgi:hypothetical protein
MDCLDVEPQHVILGQAKENTCAGWIFPLSTHRSRHSYRQLKCALGMKTARVAIGRYRFSQCRHGYPGSRRGKKVDHPLSPTQHL